jgi:hypothetical protein
MAEGQDRIAKWQAREIAEIFVFAYTHTCQVSEFLLAMPGGF